MKPSPEAALREAAKRFKAAVTDRDAKILELRSQGWSLAFLSKRFKISKQRVHQILTRGRT